VSGNALRTIAGVVVIALVILVFLVLSASDDESTLPSGGDQVQTTVVEP
jgi:preprotein translocase subunit SecG